MFRSNIKIIISYRREDVPVTVQWIHSILSDHYGREKVFIDFDSIPPGTDYRKHIKENLNECDIVLAVIGPQWIGQRDGQPPRIMDKADWPRIEIEAAMQRGIPIVPVLVEGARMPAEDQLPEQLHNLIFFQAATIGGGLDFRVHTNRLIQSIDQISLSSKPASPDLYRNIYIDRTSRTANMRLKFFTRSKYAIYALLFTIAFFACSLSGWIFVINFDRADISKFGLKLSALILAIIGAVIIAPAYFVIYKTKILRKINPYIAISTSSISSLSVAPTFFIIIDRLETMWSDNEKLNYVITFSLVTTLLVNIALILTYIFSKREKL